MNGTRSKSVSLSGSEAEKLLNDIAGKMQILINQFESLTSAVKDLTSSNKGHHEKIEEFAETLQRAVSKIDFESLNRTVGIEVQPTLNIQAETLRIKNSMKQLWAKSLNQRKQAYWNMYKCDKTCMMYKIWREKETPILPRKFLMKEINGESAEETNIRKSLSLQKFDAEISLLLSRKRRYEERFNSIDEAMRTEIEERTSDTTHTKVLELWHNDIKKEEEKSRILWQRQQAWLEEYEKNYGRESLLKQTQRPRKELKSTRNFESNKRKANGPSQPKSYAEVTKQAPHQDGTYNPRKQIPQRDRTPYRENDYYPGENSDHGFYEPPRRNWRKYANSQQGRTSNPYFLGRGRNKNTRERQPFRR